MAISVNGGSGNGNGRRRFHGVGALSEINVTPFVDVVLVLLIIFMMTAHAMEYGIEIDVPKTRTVEKSVQDLPIVQITHDGRFYLNEQPVGNIHNLPGEIRRRFPNPKGVYLKADKDVIWDVAVQVMSELGEAKLPVNIVTQPDDSGEKRRR
jgi:biopolymer transport protein ExbD